MAFQKALWRGRHSLKAGVNYRYNRESDQSFSRGADEGLFGFAGLDQFASGVLNPNGGSSYFQNFTANHVAHLRLYNVGAYAQDQWAITPRLKITASVRFRWRYVDLTLGIIKVEERFYRGETGEPKSERARRVLPLGLLTDRYKQHRPANATQDHYVFDDSGEPMDDRTILRDVIRPAAESLGLHFEGFGWHSFRRQNITVLQEEGATAFEAMAQAGHSRPSMTSDYTIVGFERREQAVRRLQERLQLGRQPISLGVN